ncbi:MAG: trehalose-phosphatase [Thermoanaerobaculia bacterium]
MRTLIATDFDGTVAGIHRDPGAVDLDPAARVLLEELARREGFDVAFLSGRDLDDLAARTEGIRAYRSGSHGRALRGPDGEDLQIAARWAGDVDPAIRHDAERSGLRLERKTAGIALHWRDVPGISREHALVARFAAWAHSQGLMTIEGRSVVEASFPGPSKAETLQHIASIARVDRVFYSGDDLTDLDAIAWAASHGRGFFVRSSEREEALPEGVVAVPNRAGLLDAWRRVLGI